MGIQADYNPALVPLASGKPSPDQAKSALLTWADQSDQTTAKRRAHYGKMALAAGAAAVALTTMLPRRAAKSSSAPSASGLLSIAGLIGLARSAVALAPIALRARATFQEYQQQQQAASGGANDTR